MLFKVLFVCMVDLIIMSCKASGIPPVILVNNMLLSDDRKYTFNDGDLVNVTCALPTKSGYKKLNMNYDFSKTFPNFPDEISKSFSQYSIKHPVGFQLRMRSSNHGTQATCTFKQEDNTNSTFTINFYENKMHDDIEHDINVCINGAALRPTTDDREYFEYLYTPYKQLNVTCESIQSEDKALFHWNDPLDNTSPSAIVLKDQDKSFKCATEEQTTTVKLKPIDVYETTPDCWMQTDVMHHNTIANPSLELYKSERRFYVYEYKKATNFSITCTARCGSSSEELNLYNFYHKSDEPPMKAGNNNISANINVSENDDYAIYQCELKDGHYKEVLMTRTLAFLRYVQPVTTTSTSTMTTTSSTMTGWPPTEVHDSDDTDTLNPPTSDARWLVPAAIGVACIVIICVSAVIYKIKTNKHVNCNPQWQAGNVNYENLTNGNSPITPFPSQWESPYAVPVDRVEEPAYCEPFTGPRGNVKNELYTMPVPKARRRPEKIKTNDPTYEDLDSNQPNMIQHEEDDPNYAEIPQSAFKNKLNLMYSQVLPKMQRQNLIKAENVNVRESNPGYEQVAPNYMRENVSVANNIPNYAQVVPKNMRKQGNDAENSPNYAQVAPKSARERDGRYVNVHKGPYVNVNAAAGSDYAEPAYCEPSFLKTSSKFHVAK